MLFFDCWKRSFFGKIAKKSGKKKVQNLTPFSTPSNRFHRAGVKKRGVKNTYFSAPKKVHFPGFALFPNSWKRGFFRPFCCFWPNPKITKPRWNFGGAIFVFSQKITYFSFVMLFQLFFSIFTKIWCLYFAFFTFYAQ